MSLRRGVKPILLALAAVMAPGAPSQAQAPAGDLPSATYAFQQKLIAIGPGRRLNLFCLGKGQPVVVLESGLGSGTEAWSRTQARIATFTTACSYDRAGYGFSDPPGRPTTTANVVDDLHRMLDAAGIARPVVLVGHSLGGLYAVRFAETYRAEVSGMVLIDPSYVGQDREMAALASKQEVSTGLTIRRDQMAHWRDCAALARARRIADMAARCDSPPADFPIDLKQRLTAYYREPKSYDQKLAETVNFQAEGERQAGKSAGFGAMPLTVLTAGLSELPPFVSKQTGARTAAAWKAAHQRLAARSTAGRSQIVAGAHHAIQLDDPDTVVQAVREVVDAARSKPGLRGLKD